MASAIGGSVREHNEDEKNLMKLCDFLRSSEGPPVREAIEMDKRVYYIKGACVPCGGGFSDGFHVEYPAWG